MKNFVKVNILAILGFSLILLLNTGSPNIYGQNFTSQTGGLNTTQQQLDEANQLKQKAQQELQQTEQQAQQANQTQQQPVNQSKQQDLNMNENLFNYTNAAILALNNDNTDAAQSNLALIQTALINETGKQIIFVPTP